MIDAFKKLDDWQNELISVSTGTFYTYLEKLDNRLILNETRKPKPPWNGGKMIVSEMTYSNIGYYWFYRLDYELLKAWHDENVNDNPWGNTSAYKVISEKIKTFRFRKCNSIEHIIPQTPEVRNDDKKIPPDNSFGNIALIQGEMNSRLHNYNIGGKIDLIQKSEIQSLKMVHFLWGKNAKAEGTEDEGEELFTFLKKKVEEGIKNVNT